MGRSPRGWRFGENPDPFSFSQVAHRICLVASSCQVLVHMEQRGQRLFPSIPCMHTSSSTPGNGELTECARSWLAVWGDGYLWSRAFRSRQSLPLCPQLWIITSLQSMHQLHDGADRIKTCCVYNQIMYGFATETTLHLMGNSAETTIATHSFVTFKPFIWSSTFF